VALDSYSNLKAAIASHLDRDDLTSYIDDFIDLAEARHKRDIRIRELVSSGSITVDARTENLPTGFLEGISFRLLTDPVTPLQYVAPEEMARLRSETSGKPKFYTILGTTIEFDKVADSAYTGDFLYHKSATALSDANTSNEILVRAPDAYLYACLLAAAPFLQDDARIEVWASLYKSCVDALAQSRRQERVAGRLTSRAYGDTP